MTRYEIRILGGDGSVLSTMSAMHVNDYAAIRSAQKVGADQPVGVWRGQDCIYREPATVEHNR